MLASLKINNLDKKVPSKKVGPRPNTRNRSNPALQHAKVP